MLTNITLTNYIIQNHASGVPGQLLVAQKHVAMDIELSGVPKLSKKNLVGDVMAKDMILFHAILIAVQVIQR